MVNPLDLPAQGPIGPLRDLYRRIGELERQVAHVRGTAMTAQAMPESAEIAPWGYQRRRLSGAVPIPNNAWTPVPWGVADSGVGNAVTSPGPTVLAAQSTGLFQFSALAHFVAGAVGPRELRVMAAGVMAVGVVSVTTADSVSLHLSETVWLDEGDGVEVQVRQGSGSTVNLYGSAADFGLFSLTMIDGG